MLINLFIKTLIYLPVIDRVFYYNDLLFVIIEIFQSSNISSTINYRIKNKRKYLYEFFFTDSTICKHSLYMNMFHLFGIKVKKATHRKNFINTSNINLMPLERQQMFLSGYKAPFDVHCSLCFIIKWLRLLGTHLITLITNIWACPNYPFMVNMLKIW